MTGDQLEISIGAAQNRRLFPPNFLSERLPEMPGFADLDVQELRATLAGLWERERVELRTANEAQTEERFIKPCLRALGFEYTVQAGLRFAGGRRQPDYALFLDDATRREAAELEGVTRYRDAVAVLDAKRFDRPLDVRRARGALSEDPVAQIIQYIQATRCSWGILTNGRMWRLYALEGDLVEAACYEVDLVDLLEGGDEEAFRYFAAFFSASALRPDAHGQSFLDRALADGTANARELGEDLEEQVFAAVPRIAEGLLGRDAPDEDNLAAAFEGSLVFLYRLLFCLHAEARELLPVNEPHYFPYSVREQKERLAAEIDAGRQFSSSADELYNELRALFRMIDQGDDRLGVNEYDGGLFAPSRHPYFEGRSIPDDLLAPALDGLYRVGMESIDYRSLSVRHLGTIYERLLEYRLAEDGDGLTLEPSEGRRNTGSYFTPEPVVDLIVERTLEPILEQRSAVIAERDLSSDAALEAFLELKILDPAMGSGHFLVSAASYMALYIATDPSYSGDLDRGEIRRLVAERCLFGVDLNPMAVELARLSLWLITVKGDEPLTFLGNLRHGNSLVGANIEELLEGDGGLFASALAREAEGLLDRISEILSIPSSSGDEVHEKDRLTQAVEALREPLGRFADEEISPAFTHEIGRFFHWEIEFPHVFLSSDGALRPDGGFDAIVGNPPYIRIQALGRELAAYCRDRFQVASGSFDAYIVFFERCIQLLAPTGRLGFITPNKFTKLASGARLRELLAGRRLIEEIIDFGDTQVFPGATNYTAIVILDQAGTDRMTYFRPDKEIGADDVMRGVETASSEEFELADLESRPWVLAAGEEVDVLAAAGRGSVPLEEVTTNIFTGLQTGADPIYILDDRGQARDGGRRVWCRADEEEHILEPDLLHPLASGADVDRFAFKPLESMLLFPYRRTEGGVMDLLTEEQLEHLPHTLDFLRSHEAVLRARERGGMDRDGWWAFTRTQSLGLHDLPKLGVPRLCDRLKASPDGDGLVYLDNVDVNGIVPREGGISIMTILPVLNSRLLDFVFRRGSVPFRGHFYSANKQFIAPLPIRIPDVKRAEELEELGSRLHGRAVRINEERMGFHRWLGGTIGVAPGELPGQERILAYDEAEFDDWFGVLRRGLRRYESDTTSRAFRENVESEWRSSNARLGDLRSAQEADERIADDLIFDLYEIPARLRRVVDAEYE